MLDNLVIATEGPLAANAPERPSLEVIHYINLKLAALGCPTVELGDDVESGDMAALLAHQRETRRLLANYLPPADQRIQTFLYDYLQDAPLAKLPVQTFALDRP